MTSASVQSPSIPKSLRYSFSRSLSSALKKLQILRETGFTLDVEERQRLLVLKTDLDRLLED